MKEAAAQEGVRQFFLIIGGDDNQRACLGLNGFAGLVNKKFHPGEILEQVIGELDVGLINLINQQNDAPFMGKSFPEFAAVNIVFNIFDAFIPELAIP